MQKRISFVVDPEGWFWTKGCGAFAENYKATYLLLMVTRRQVLIKRSLGFWQLVKSQMKTTVYVEPTYTALIRVATKVELVQEE